MGDDGGKPVSARDAAAAGCLFVAGLAAFGLGLGLAAAVAYWVFRIATGV